MALGASAFASEAFKVLTKIKIGGTGGWDYLALDLNANPVYASDATLVEVVDRRAGKVQTDPRPGCRNPNYAQPRTWQEFFNSILAPLRLDAELAPSIARVFNRSERRKLIAWPQYAIAHSGSRRLDLLNSRRAFLQLNECSRARVP